MIKRYNFGKAVPWLAALALVAVWILGGDRAEALDGQVYYYPPVVTGSPGVSSGMVVHDPNIYYRNPDGSLTTVPPAGYPAPAGGPVVTYGSSYPSYPASGGAVYYQPAPAYSPPAYRGYAGDADSPRAAMLRAHQRTREESYWTRRPTPMGLNLSWGGGPDDSYSSW